MNSDEFGNGRMARNSSRVELLVVCAWQEREVGEVGKEKGDGSEMMESA